MMQIGDWNWIAFFATLPVLALFLWRATTRRERARAAFARSALLVRITTGLQRERPAVRATCLLGGFFFLGVALLRPQWGFHWEEVTRKGIDVIVAIDTSKSMLATDAKPNRLEVAKRKIEDLLRLSTGDRVGLVAFAGASFLECPLTLDYGAIKLFLEDIEVGIIPRGGTALRDAIEKGASGFEDEERDHKAILLFTDGEDLEGDADAAVKIAKDKGLSIYAIGIGSPEGSLIQIDDGKGGKSFLKDSDGNVVKTRLDEETLKKIALDTGGAYTRATPGSRDIEDIYAHIAKMGKKDLGSLRTKRFEERFQWPLAAALVLFVTEEALRLGRRRREEETP
ncbi:MAG: VWA domain-containing protein [Planctomycetes bacterium]|nr:VWA domain-containing protein [Planctomycetota bacterium]